MGFPCFSPSALSHGVVGHFCGRGWLCPAATATSQHFNLFNTLNTTPNNPNNPNNPQEGHGRGSWRTRGTGRIFSPETRFFEALSHPLPRYSSLSLTTPVSTCVYDVLLFHPLSDLTMVLAPPRCQLVAWTSDGLANALITSGQALVSQHCYSNKPNTSPNNPPPDHEAKLIAPN